MILVGLTGGIASGKSKVSAALNARGALIIDADALAKDVLAPGTEGLQEVVRAFGPEYLDPEGALRRDKLAKLVFADQSARETLNGIVHPRVRAASAMLREGAADDQIVVEDIPLLAESDQAGRFNLVVVVESDEATQITRMCETRGMSEDEARARIHAQATPEARRAIADVLIDNNGTEAQLYTQVDTLWKMLQKMQVETERVRT